MKHLSTLTLATSLMAIVLATGCTKPQEQTPAAPEPTEQQNIDAAMAEATATIPDEAVAAMPEDVEATQEAVATAE